MSNFSAIPWRKPVTFKENDNDVRFVQYQHAYIASSLKQQSAGRRVAPLGYIM